MEVVLRGVASGCRWGYELWRLEENQRLVATGEMWSYEVWRLDAVKFGSRGATTSYVGEVTRYGDQVEVRLLAT